MDHARHPKPYRLNETKLFENISAGLYGSLVCNSLFKGNDRIRCGIGQPLERGEQNS